MSVLETKTVALQNTALIAVRERERRGRERERVTERERKERAHLVARGIALVAWSSPSFPVQTLGEQGLVSPFRCADSSITSS